MLDLISHPEINDQQAIMGEDDVGFGGNIDRFYWNGWQGQKGLHDEDGLSFTSRRGGADGTFSRGGLRGLN